MTPLRVAVWGVGRHATRKILPAIQHTGALQLHGICSRNGDVVAAEAAQWNCQAWTDASAMLADPLVDAVYVATPIGLHAEHGRRVIDAGKHLWCEKPLATSLAATRELLDRAARRGRSVCEGMMYLHHPHFRQLSEYVTRGTLGQVISIGSRFGIPPLEYSSFRTDPALGGGALFDVGCYPVSAVHALFPDQGMRVVMARVGVRGQAAVDTDGSAVLELSNGVLAHLEWRINCAYRNEITVWGTAASVTTDQIFSKPPTYVPEFRVRDLRGAERTEAGEAADHFVAMLEHFAAIANGRADADAERARLERTAAVLDEICARRSR